MSSIAIYKRIGRMCLNFNKSVMTTALKRHESSVNKDKPSSKENTDKWDKYAKKTIGGGIGVVLTSLAVYATYRTLNTQEKLENNEENTEKTENNEKNTVRLQDPKFTYFGKGNVIGDVMIKVEKNGTTLEFFTDLNGKSRYLVIIERYTNDKYEFLPKPGINPKIYYNEEEKESIIKFYLSKIETGNDV